MLGGERLQLAKLFLAKKRKNESSKKRLDSIGPKNCVDTRMPLQADAKSPGDDLAMKWFVGNKFVSFVAANIAGEKKIGVRIGSNRKR